MRATRIAGFNWKMAPEYLASRDGDTFFERDAHRESPTAVRLRALTKESHRWALADLILDLRGYPTACRLPLQTARLDRLMKRLLPVA